MKKLIKAIVGQDCEIYAISHHNRLMVGKATPNVEVYENSQKVPTIGNNQIQYKNTYFSIVICPNTDMDKAITEDILKDLKEFELLMYLPDKKGVLVPFNLYGVNVAELSDKQWIFDITDKETVNKLLAL